MSTFAHALVSSTDERWSEVNVLLGTAARTDTSDELRNALCRASAVLIVAHFEGFIKEAARAIISDINQHSTFQHTHNHIKRVFCRTFTGSNGNAPDKDDNERETRLISLLDGLNAKIDFAPFVGGTSNPKPDVVERICNSLGAENFFARINSPWFDPVFSGTDPEIGALLTSLKDHLNASVDVFPYKVQPALFGMDKSNGKSRSGGGGGKSTTLWETFLDSLLAQRHTIAHGTSGANGNSVTDVQRMKTKTQILMFSALLAMCAPHRAKANQP